MGEAAGTLNGRLAGVLVVIGKLEKSAHFFEQIILTTGLRQEIVSAALIRGPAIVIQSAGGQQRSRFLRREDSS